MSTEKQVALITNLFELYSENEIDKLLEKHSSILTILMFYKTTSKISMELKPTFINMSTYNKDINFVLVDIDNFSKNTQKYNYENTMFIYMYNKKEEARGEGVDKYILMRLFNSIKQLVKTRNIHNDKVLPKSVLVHNNNNNETNIRIVTYNKNNEKNIKYVKTIIPILDFIKLEYEDITLIDDITKIYYSYTTYIYHNDHNDQNNKIYIAYKLEKTDVLKKGWFYKYIDVEEKVVMLCKYTEFTFD
jgi:hypothetical protein